jgi:hypothetical protein
METEGTEVSEQHSEEVQLLIAEVLRRISASLESSDYVT